MTVDMASPPMTRLEIDSLSLQGEGVARDATGRVWFVPRTAPGDEAVVEPVRVRPTWARGRLGALLRPGPDRVEAPCPHYAACGGCDLQHVGPDAQERAWSRGLADTLARIGGLDAAYIRPLISAPPALGYRNRVTLTLRRRRGGVAAGYHALRSPESIADVHDCLLAEPAIREAWRALRTVWGEHAAALPAGRELRLTLRASRDGGVALIVRTVRAARDRSGRAERTQVGDVEHVAQAIPGLESYWWYPRHGRRRLLWGAPCLTDRWEGIRLELGPEAFVQVNRSVAAEMEAYIDDGLGSVEGARILDLYAGVGLRALRWSSRGAEAVAVESNRDAVQAGRRAARSASRPVRYLHGQVETRLYDVLPARAAVVNPPRTGLSADVTGQLASSSLDRLIYVSCDAATLARDLDRLRTGWAVRSIQPFAAFPQTGHVESVTILARPVEGGGR